MTCITWLTCFPVSNSIAARICTWLCGAEFGAFTSKRWEYCKHAHDLNELTIAWNNKWKNDKHKFCKKRPSKYAATNSGKSSKVRLLMVLAPLPGVPTAIRFGTWVSDTSGALAAVGEAVPVWSCCGKQLNKILYRKMMEIIVWLEMRS